MGIGLVMVVAPFYAESIRHQLAHGRIKNKLKNWLIGRVEKGSRGVVSGRKVARHSSCASPVKIVAAVS